MRVHQAFYGEERGAHTLLRHSDAAASEEVPFKELIGLTDRFGSVPPGVQWGAYVSGYPCGDYYVLSRTFPDGEASRPGMVLTHALLAPLEELSACSVLADVTRHLWAGTERYAELPVLVVTPLAQGPPADVSDERQLAMVRSLVRSAPQGAPVVWASQDDFERTIEALWFHLWPRARRNVRFRLSFGPADVEGQEFIAVCTPKPLLNRWSAPYITVSDGQVEAGPLTLAEAYLLGRDEAAPLRAFQDSLGASLGSITDLLMLVRCFESLSFTGDSEDANEDADAVRRIARLLAQLSPSAAEGDRIKRPLIEKLARLTANGSVSDIRSLRNFDPRPFADGAELLEAGIQSWVRRVLTSSVRPGISDTASLVKLALSTPTDWGDMVRRGLRGGLESWSQTIASRIWEWWGTDPDLVTLLEGLLPETVGVEQVLALECPSRLGPQLATRAIGLATERLWYSLHAAVLGATCEPEEALRRQLAFDYEKQGHAALHVLANRIGDEPFLLAAVRLGDPRLITLAAGFVARTPRLRSHLDVSNSRWRDVWVLSIQAGAPTFDGISDPRASVHILMDILTDGGHVADDLLAAVAATAYADLDGYPGRSAVWRRLPPAVLPCFLRATAIGWLQRFRDYPDVAQPVEPALSHSLIGEAVRILGSPEVDPGFTLRLFRRFPDLGEPRFNQWLAGLRSVGADEAVLVGKYIAERGWAMAAKSAWEQVSHGRRDFLPVVKECRHLLRALDRWKLRLAGSIKPEDRLAPNREGAKGRQRKDSGHRVDDEEWWQALVDVSAELYPRGLEERNIWPRSAGELSVVELKSPGRSQWEKALSLLRAGGGVNVSVAGLLHQMRKDYPANEDLQLLELDDGREESQRQALRDKQGN